MNIETNSLWRGCKGSFIVLETDAYEHFLECVDVSLCGLAYNNWKPILSMSDALETAKQLSWLTHFHSKKFDVASDNHGPSIVSISCTGLHITTTMQTRLFHKKENMTTLIAYVAPFTDINGLFTAVPEVMISESKWSFMYNGASLCLRSIYRLKHVIEVTCLNGQPASAGRYITFLLRRPPLVNILQRTKGRFWKIQINRAESK